MTEMIGRFASVNDTMCGREAGTSLQRADTLTKDAEREPWAIRLSARRRLAIVIAVGIAVYSIGPAVVPIVNRLLVTWIAASMTYLILYWLTILHADADLTRRRASKYDQAAYVIFLLVTTAACASIVAIGFVMGDVKSLDFWPKALHVGLSIAALVLSWMLIHTVFAFHYARRYYAPASVREGPAAGLSFPGVEKPAYFDFAYYSFVLGMTSQVSDVAVTTAQMRRTTLAHGILSFLFNIAVLAMSINVIGGIL
jgi:uncharacterized membrane protein